MTARQVRRTARQLYRICVVQGGLDAARVRDVTGRLAGSKRRGALRVLTAFHRQIRLDRDRHTASVESAIPLDPRLRAQIQARVAHAYGPRIDTTFGENPALIAGVRVKVGSDVFDGSVRSRLAALEARL